MTPRVPPPTKILDRASMRELPVREFERWVYDSPELEAEFGARDNLRLRVFDDGHPVPVHESPRRLPPGVHLSPQT